MQNHKKGLKNTNKTYQKSLIHQVFATTLALFIVNQWANAFCCVNFYDAPAELCKKENGEKNESACEDKLPITNLPLKEQQTSVSLFNNCTSNHTDITIIKGISTPPPEL